MKLSLPDRISLKLGQKYLDWAERFPHINLGPVRSLRTIRKFQRKRSERAFAYSRTPDGAKLSFPYFRLLEVFHLEDFTQLHRGLVKLLPGLVDLPIHRTFSSDFDRESRSLRGTSWKKLGYLVRDQVPFLVGLDAHRKIPNLPEEVWLIEVELHRILPSVYAITFDVHLTDSATNHLAQLHSRPYLPTVSFHSVIPLKKLGRTIHLGGHSESNPEDEMGREILSWLEMLRRGVEVCIRPYLSGYFTNEETERLTRLPALEVYALSGAPEEKDTFNKWAADARFWLEPFGFSRIYESYSNESFAFLWGREDRQVGKWPNRLIVMLQPFLKSLDLDRYEDESSAIMHETKYTLNALTQCVALLEYLQSIERKVEKIRTVTVERMNSPSRLRTYLKLSSNILRESYLLDRLALEFGQEKPLVEDGIAHLDALKDNFPGDSHIKLNDAVLNSIELRIEFLKTQLSSVSSSFSEFLELRNMFINYDIQRYVFWLSLIATFASVIGTVAAIMSVIVSWGAIKQFLNDVFGIVV